LLVTQAEPLSTLGTWLQIPAPGGGSDRYRSRRARTSLQA
jgi:hypothetical protein